MIIGNFIMQSIEVVTKANQLLRKILPIGQRYGKTQKRGSRDCFIVLLESSIQSADRVSRLFLII